jgi:hypothetical protein
MNERVQRLHLDIARQFGSTARSGHGHAWRCRQSRARMVCRMKKARSWGLGRREDLGDRLADQRCPQRRKHREHGSSSRPKRLEPIPCSLEFVRMREGLHVKPCSALRCAVDPGGRRTQCRPSRWPVESGVPNCPGNPSPSEIQRRGQRWTPDLLLEDLMSRWVGKRGGVRYGRSVRRIVRLERVGV